MQLISVRHISAMRHHPTDQLFRVKMYVRCLGRCIFVFLLSSHPHLGYVVLVIPIHTTSKIMKILTVLALFTGGCVAHNSTGRIYSAAAADNIDLDTLPFAAEAIASIQAIYDFDNITIPPGVTNGDKFDVHAHVVPPWYRTLVPTSGQFPTPSWTLEAHLNFMASAGIRHSVLSVGTPGSVVFPGSQPRSLALARLLNEYLAALVHKFPQIFSFFAVTPLPYTAFAVTEAEYALTHLHAAGIGLQSNHEGYYLGNRAFTPFFSHFNNSGNVPPIFVHPAGPCLRSSNGSLTSANPTLYPEGLVEFYFETARSFMDLTLTQTVINFTSLKWLVPHAGGAFPAIEDRFLTSQPAELQERNREAFETRFWWDVAGPVFPRQVQGLFGYGVPVERLVYGSVSRLGLGIVLTGFGS